MSEKVAILFRVEERVRDRLRIRAVEEGRDIQDILGELLEAYLEGKELQPEEEDLCDALRRLIRKPKKSVPDEALLDYLRVVLLK